MSSSHSLPAGREKERFLFFPELLLPRERLLCSATGLLTASALAAHACRHGGPSHGWARIDICCGPAQLAPHSPTATLAGVVIGCIRCMQ